MLPEISNFSSFIKFLVYAKVYNTKIFFEKFKNWEIFIFGFPKRLTQFQQFVVGAPTNKTCGNSRALFEQKALTETIKRMY